MTHLKPENSLEDIRREIDAIDDAILDLLVRRFEATAKVRATKSKEGTLSVSPLRPAREAEMLRRLIAGAEDKVPAELVVRLWRVILSASIQTQAPIALHLDQNLFQSLGARLKIGEYFSGIPLRCHRSMNEAFEALSGAKGDLAVMAAGASWAEAFASVAKSGLRIISALPLIHTRAEPELLIFGHAVPLPSGHDETIFVMPKRHEVPPGLPLRWQKQSGAWLVLAIAGFVPEAHPAFKAIVEHIPGSHLAGRLPSSLEVQA